MSFNERDNNKLIIADELSKTYRVWKKPVDRLLSLMIESLSKILKSTSYTGWLNSKNANLFENIVALKPMSLVVEKGTATGIIGRNGAGKSTLLQLITGSLTPSTGKVHRLGRIAALLELGSGFDNESTGIQNIRINAALLGLSRDEISAKMDSILEYAGIGDFVYKPVRTYSSGMRMRLAFAVAAHVEADVIIIDEALGVGDARFQLKCSKTIEGHLKAGRALLFVSHSMNSVKQLCDRAILLHEGEKLMEGDPNSVANIYSRIVAGDTLVEVKQHIEKLKSEESTATENEVESILVENSKTINIENINYDLVGLRSRLATLSDPKQINKVKKLLEEDSITQTNKATEFNYGGELGQITNIKILDDKDEERQVFQTGERFSVYFEVSSKQNFDEPIYAMTIKSTTGQELYVCNSLYRGLTSSPIQIGENKSIYFRQKMNLMQGDYFLSLGFVTFIGDELLVLHRRYDVVKIQVLPEDRCHGVVNLDSTIEVVNSN